MTVNPRQSTSGLSSAQLSRLRLERLGFVFQFHFLLAEFSILENVLVPMHKAGTVPMKQRREQAERSLHDLGLADHLHKKPSGLSGGERQRVAIARAMANRPAVILADEPTGNLDSKSSRNVQEIFHNPVKTHQTGIIMVTHDMKLASDCKRRIHLIDGRVDSDKRQN